MELLGQDFHMKCILAEQRMMLWYLEEMHRELAKFWVSTDTTSRQQHEQKILYYAYTVEEKLRGQEGRGRTSAAELEQQRSKIISFLRETLLSNLALIDEQQAQQQQQQECGSASIPEPRQVSNHNHNYNNQGTLQHQISFLQSTSPSAPPLPSVSNLLTGGVHPISSPDLILPPLPPNVPFSSPSPARILRTTTTTYNNNGATSRWSDQGTTRANTNIVVGKKKAIKRPKAPGGQQQQQQQVQVPMTAMMKVIKNGAKWTEYHNPQSSTTIAPQTTTFTSPPCFHTFQLPNHHTTNRKPPATTYKE